VREGGDLHDSIVNLVRFLMEKSFLDFVYATRVPFVFCSRSSGLFLSGDLIFVLRVYVTVRLPLAWFGFRERWSWSVWASCSRVDSSVCAALLIYRPQSRFQAVFPPPVVTATCFIFGRP
jgi:hypothetical protein